MTDSDSDIPEKHNNSVNIGNLIKEQYSIKGELEAFRGSYIKLPKERQTHGVITGKLGNIKECWKQFCTNNRKIEAHITDTEKQQLPYFKETLFENVEAFFSNFLGELMDALDKFSSNPHVYVDNIETAPKNPNSQKNVSKSITSQISNTDQVSPSQLKLPRIDIPKFTGNYANWRSFHDLFTTLIHNNTSIPNVQKLYFLKTNVDGEAAKLIRHLDICEKNYNPAWELLVQRFDNKRIIVNNHLKILTSQNVIKSESSDAIKRLLDTTNECLHSLRSLDIEVDTWDAIIIYLIVQKLPMETRDLWERTVGNSKDLPKLKTLLDFLETRFRILEMLRGTSNNDTNSSKFKKETRSFHVKKSHSCLLCNQPHLLRQCQQFLSMDPQSRKNFVSTKPLCLNCFAMSHPTQGCNSPKSCYHCGQKHHSLLHAETLPKATEFNFKNTQSNSNPYSNPSTSEQRLTSLFIDKTQHSSNVLLATALIKVITLTGIHTLRALIDPGSQGSFITENAVQKLQLKKYKTSVRITGLGTSSAGTSTHQVYFKVQSFSNDNFSCEVNAYVLKSLTTVHPTEHIDLSSTWNHIHGLSLADPTFNTPGRIDVLLGVDVYPHILTDGLRKGNAYVPAAQNTYLGWVLFGNCNGSKDKCESNRGISLTSHHSCIEAEKLLRRFWELEDIQEGNRKLTEEEQKCEQHYNATHCRLENGRYQVSLPFTELKRPLLGESRNAALSRLYSMERKLSKESDTYKQYRACLNEYISLDHMRPATTLELEHITTNPDGNSRYTVNYLPHHAVFKDSTTTQLRVVFDASHRTTNGLSLNDTLLKGPKLQEDIISVMMRWRKHHIAFSADITQMYRQISLTESDTAYQRIIWRDIPTEPIKE